MKLNELSIIEAKKGLKDKEFSSVELIKACLEQIKKYNKDLNVFITVCEEEALRQAENTDALISSDPQAMNYKSLLGIPIAIKDLFCTKGIKTTAASNVLKNYIPQYDATVIAKLKEAGAITIGKVNCDAWAHGSSGENSDFGPTKNPWDTDCVPGGSSSGSAVSVTANMCIAATGTDTGGSIRLPASFNSVVGLKPTYGRVSRYGIIAMASSLDSIGHITKTVEDSAIFLNITAGQDKNDATTCSKKVPNYIKSLKNGIKGMRLGICRKDLENVDSEIREAMLNAEKQLKKMGAEFIDMDFKYTDSAIACYYIIQPSEVSSNLARYDGIRYGEDRNAFGDEAKRRIMLGTFALSSGYYDAYYKNAMKIRTLLRNEYDEKFKKVDAVISPVSPTLPWRLGEKTSDPLGMYMSDVFTVTANLTGIPGLSVPAGFANGLPVGIQIFGPHYSEEKLFQIGYAYEQATKGEAWRRLKPKL